MAIPEFIPNGWREIKSSGWLALGQEPASASMSRPAKVGSGINNATARTRISSFVVWSTRSADLPGISVAGSMPLMQVYKSKGEIASLTGLRGSAALMVVIAHYCHWAAVTPVSALPNRSSNGAALPSSAWPSSSR
jgi:hypothetical protein